MVLIEKCGIVASNNGRKFKTNLCSTPNGILIVSCGCFYRRVNTKMEVVGESWYIGTENGFELWQYEKMGKDGFYKVVTKKVKIK